MRANDLYGVKSEAVSIVSKSKGADRHIKIVLERMKNDPDGTASVEDRTVRIPCHCLHLLEEDYLIRKFRKDLNSNSEATCPMACPYNAVMNYLALIPDAFGVANAAMRQMNPTLEPLYFARALTTVNDRRYTLSRLGEIYFI